MSNNQKQILIADDEPDVVALVSQSLISAGFQVQKATDGTEALEKARRLEPALIVLDLMMPGMSGNDVLRSLRGDPRTAGIAVIILTARKDEVDRIVSLELGADDYVTKPFSPRELTLRVKSILSRRGMMPTLSRHSSIGSISLDRDRHEVRVDSKKVDITAVEFRLLSALFRQPGRVFSREELLASVWGADSDIEIRTVDTHLRRLRERLGSAAEQVQTVRGFGYRLNE